MEKRTKVVLTIIIINLTLLLASYFYRISLENVVVEDQYFTIEPKMANENKPTKNIVEFEGLYQKLPRSSTLNIDILFKNDSTSLWIVQMPEVTDTIAKKFEVKGDKLLITHNIAKMKQEIESYSKTGNKQFAKATENSLNSMPKIDTYKIILNSDSTITLDGKQELVLKRVK